MNVENELQVNLPEPVEFVRVVVKSLTDPVWFLENVLHIEPFPAQADIIRAFYKRNYKRLILVAGMRSGKSNLAAMISAYEFFKLYVLDNPAERFGLMRKQPIFVSVISTSSDQAEDAVFANVRTFIDDSEFFGDDVRVRDKVIECKRKNIFMRTLSSWSTTAVGRTNKAVIFDELALFEETSGKRGAWEVFSRLTKSTDTFGNDGKIVAISSPKHPNDIIMTLYRQHVDDKKSLTLMKPTWEMNPRLTKEQLMEEYKYELTSFWRDYACQPQVSHALQFPEGVTLEGPNIIHHEDRSKIRIMAIDPAVRNDSFGIAVGYKEGDNIVVDGAWRFRRDEEAYISPSEVKEFLRSVVQRLNIIVMITDTWMFPELVEWAENEMGLIVQQHVVRKVDYDRWRELQLAGRLRICNYDVIKYEAESLLILSDRRVDHPFGGSKDVADCVANVIWYLETQDLPVEFKTTMVRII